MLFTQRRVRSASRPRLLVAVTASESWVLLRGQLAAASAAGFDVYVLSAPGPTAARIAREECVQHLAVPMARDIRPGRDLVSLLRIVRLLQQLRPDIVNSGTPKAGLLVGVGAWLTGVPVRIHTLRGLRFETQTGAKRLLVRVLTRVTCATADRVVCISPSLRERAVAARVVPPAKAVVLGAGSSNGIDTERFSTTPELEAAGAALRARLGIPDTARVIGYVGRMTRDKGVEELRASWESLRQQYPDVHILMVGNFDRTDPISAATRLALERDERVHLVGPLDDVRCAYVAMDVLVLPTHREGFGNVLLEAAAMRRPAVAFDVTGARDAVAHGETGLLVPAHDVEALGAAIARYLDDPQLRARHGAAGERRARELFRRESVWQLLHAEYSRCLNARGEAIPAIVGS